jgi:hypothetical protein
MVRRVSKKRVRVYHQVGQERPQSTTWQMWMHRTSVYLVNSALGSIKVTLHGIDTRHPGAEHFRVEPDPRRGLGLISQRGIELLPPSRGWPVRFSGISAPLGDFAIRHRVTEQACVLAPPPPTFSGGASSMHARLPTPKPGWAADIDLVFEQLPRGMEPVGYRGQVVTVGHEGVQLIFPFPESEHHVVDEPGFLMKNTYGIVLRGRTRNRRLDLHPTPPHLLGPTVKAGEVAQRAVAIDADDQGLLWIVEQAVRGHSSHPQIVSDYLR